MTINTSTNWEDNVEIPNRYDYNLVVYFRNLNFALANTKDESRYVAVNKNGEKIIGFFEKEQYWIQLEKFVCVNFQGKYGLLGENARIVVPFEFDSPIYFSHRGLQKELFAIAKKDGKERIIRQDGSILEIYDKVYSIEDDGFGKVIRNGKWGVIDNEGNEVIPPILDDSFTCDGLERQVSVSSHGKYGFLNEKGELLIPFVYDYSFGFSNEGLAVVSLNGEVGIINKKNEKVIPFGSYDLQWLKDAVMNPNIYFPDSSHSNSNYLYIPLTTHAKNGYKQSVLFSPEWKLLSPAPYDDYKDSTSEYREVRRLYKCGLINRNGEEVIPCIYGDIYRFSNQYILAWKNEDGGKGIVDFSNKVIVPFIHKSIDWVETTKGYIFICELIQTRSIDKLYAVYNDKGMMVIPYQKQEIWFKNEFVVYKGSEKITYELEHLSIGKDVFMLNGTKLDVEKLKENLKILP